MKLTKLIIATLTSFALSHAVTFADTGIPKDYPLKKCPISDEEYSGSMKPYKVTYEGTDVWLCCKSCKKDFDKNPAKYTEAVKEAKAKK